MGSAGGGQALAEGEIPCLRCSMPQRVSVGLMYVSSFVLLVLSGARGFLVIRDNRCPFLISLVDCFAFLNLNLRSVHPSLEILPQSACL